jgi:hypothetical protein
MPSIVVSTSSPPANAGTSALPGVGGGVAVGTGDGVGEGVGSGVGDGDGVGVGVAIGGNVQADAIRQTAMARARRFPTATG